MQQESFSKTAGSSKPIGYKLMDEIFDRFCYPAGESHIKLKPEAELAALRVIEAAARNFEDLAQIVTADRILRRNRIQVRWFVPYFPFARHDRRNNAGDGFELQLALELVRELDLVIADPHSEVAAQLPHFGQSDSVAALRDIGLFDGDVVVVIPDAGAAKKAYDWINSEDVVQAQKKRDVNTGALSGFSIPVDDLKGRPCVIFDDICDGGGTFIGLAQELRNANAGSLSLAVTHGLFTKGVDALFEYFDAIYCFESRAASKFISGRDNLSTRPFSSLYAGGTIR